MSPTPSPAKLPLVAGLSDELTTGAARFTARKGEYVQVAGCEFTRI